jgi:cytidylate kinase
MTQKPFIIAIDGPTASGKGTLSSKIATILGFEYMDTGSLYRGVAKTCLDQSKDPQNASHAIAAAKHLLEHYSPCLQDDPSIRTELVSKGASEVAAVPEVREILLDLQRNFSQKNTKGVVIEGRDIGTIICPNADIKLFIDATAEIRADRRYKQLTKKSLDASLQEVLKQINIRDGRDKDRKTAPTLPAKDAIIIDTSKMSAKEVLDHALMLIKEKL